MADFKVSDIRNVGLFSHVGTGKTSVVDAMLFNSGQNNRIGSVDEGTSMLDTEPEEQKRKASISLSLASFDWKNARLNIIDTPGGSNFFSDAKKAMQAVDSAILVIDAVDGLKIQSMKLIKQIQEADISCAVFVNKLDRENADYASVLNSLEGAFAPKIVPIQLPLGGADNFRGVIDLLKLDALVYGDKSGNYSEENIPEGMSFDLEPTRESAIESIVECDDAILEKYLEGQDLTDIDIKLALQKGIRNKQIVPVLFGSATNNVGIDLLMDLIAVSMPDPTQREPISAKNIDGQETEIIPSADEPFSSIVFKTITDPYAGQLSLIRVFSGEMSTDNIVYNPLKKEKERIGQILHLTGKKNEISQHAICGDIVAVPKLKATHTGDTLCSEKNPVIINAATIPEPVISFAIKPKNKGEEEKIAIGLKKIMEEDVSIKLSRDEQTHEMILSGMGQVHLDITIEKLQRKFGVEVILEKPKIPYRETITATSKVQGKYKKQSGGKGQYGDCWVEFQPIDNTRDLEFMDNIVGGAIPRQYIPAVETGIKEAMQTGVLAGYPMVGLKAVLYDGSYHTVDSSEMAFKMAGSFAFKKGTVEAHPVLLEPVMSVEITVPDENVGDVVGDLNSRRGRMLGIDSEDHSQIIKAHIPMAEMATYAADLNSMTSGAGVFHMELDHYEEVPSYLSQKIIDETKNLNTSSE